MTARIDHASEALKALGHITGVDEATNQITLALEAQVHATLALVEQQRLANLIAFHDVATRQADAGHILSSDGLARVERAARE
ncbi:hypothetical protein, partial [Salmonella enterica]|uniref:hypothetical protein n=2 Tax=Bacteria TaxID=2 RepID=UPI0021B35025